MAFLSEGKVILCIFANRFLLHLYMSKIDLLIALPLCVGFVIGLFKGFAKEIASLVAIVLGIYAAKLFAPVVAGIFKVLFGLSEHTALLFSWVVLFLLIAIGLFLLTRSLEKLFNSMSLGLFNKLLGGLFGALKYALVISVLLVVVDAVDSHFSLIDKDTKSASILYKPVISLAPALWDEAKKVNK